MKHVLVYFLINIFLTDQFLFTIDLKLPGNQTKVVRCRVDVKSTGLIVCSQYGMTHQQFDVTLIRHLFIWLFIIISRLISFIVLHSNKKVCYLKCFIRQWNSLFVHYILKWRCENVFTVICIVTISMVHEMNIKC